MDPVESLILDLIEWIDLRERTYEDTLTAWRTSCPRLPVWEDATDRGFISTDQSKVWVAAQGRAHLDKFRPSARLIVEAR